MLFDSSFEAVEKSMTSGRSSFDERQASMSCGAVVILSSHDIWRLSSLTICSLAVGLW